MDITTFMIAVYCLIEDSLPERRLRQRGPQPTLRDSEVLTIEVVGEFLGLDTESNIFAHFCRHYSDWFPGLRQITRTTFTRQAANLWKVKQDCGKCWLNRFHMTPIYTLSPSPWQLVCWQIGASCSLRL